MQFAYLLVIIYILQNLCASYEVVFEEKFSDGGNLENWVIEENLDISGSCSLYRNNRSNVFVDSEGLHLQVTRGEFSKCPRGGCVFSGRIHSVKSWLGGIFSVRAKVPKSNPNLWPALWITASDRILLCFYSSFCPKELVLLLLIIKEKWPICGEIDIMETWGNNSHVMGTLHCGNSSDDRTAHPGIPTYPKNVYSNPNFDVFNTYTVNWQKNKIEFFLNANIDSNGVSGKPLLTIYSAYWDSCPPLTTPLNWVFNVAVGGYDRANCGIGNCWGECQSAVGSEMIISEVQVWQ